MLYLSDSYDYKKPWKVSQKICRSESTLNCKSCYLCIKLTDTTRREKLGQKSWLKGCNDQLCMYVCMYVSAITFRTTVSFIASKYVIMLL